MVTVISLWLPILLSAVLVFIVSSVIHMMLGYHRNDYRKLANEADFRSAVGPLNIAPGDYVVPKPADQKQMRTPDYIEKTKEGPVLWMTVLPNGEFNMTKSLINWFVYSVIVGIFAAYIAGRALPAGADYMAVFRFVGTTAFAGYALALMQNSIWYNRAWSTTLKSMFDGLVYALVTAGVFGWLWPS